MTSHADRRIRIEDGERAIHTAFGVYREVVVPSRLAYTWDWEGETSVGETAAAAEGHGQGWTACPGLLETLFAHRAGRG